MHDPIQIIQRGNITISSNEFVDPSKDGGLTLTKILRCKKPLLTIVGHVENFVCLFKIHIELHYQRGKSRL